MEVYLNLDHILKSTFHRSELATIVSTKNSFVGSVAW